MLVANVEGAPEGADQDFIRWYFSRGVLLEADLIGKHLLDAPGGSPASRVLQIYRRRQREAGASKLAAFLRPRRGACPAACCRRTTASAVTEAAPAPPVPPVPTRWCCGYAA